MKNQRELLTNSFEYDAAIAITASLGHADRLPSLATDLGWRLGDDV